MSIREPVLVALGSVAGVQIVVLDRHTQRFLPHFGYGHTGSERSDMGVMSCYCHAVRPPLYTLRLRLRRPRNDAKR